MKRAVCACFVGTRVVAISLSLAVLSACGGDGGNNTGVRFHGNIIDVIVPDEQQASADELRSGEPTAFRRLVAFLFPAAVAQQECDPDAADVLACAATGRGEDCEDSAVECTRVNPSSCDFAAEIRVTCVQAAGLFFVLDENGNGQFDSDEKDASLVVECEGEDFLECIRKCNGDVVRARDVTIEFFAEPVEEENGIAHAEEVEKTRDACPEPPGTATPTATATPTPTATPLLPLP